MEQLFSAGRLGGVHTRSAESQMLIDIGFIPFVCLIVVVHIPVMAVSTRIVPCGIGTGLLRDGRVTIVTGDPAAR